MFYYGFQEDRAYWYQGAVYWIPRTFQLRQRQMRVNLPMGQGQNSAIGVLRAAAHPRTATPHESLTRRVARSRCFVETQNAAVALNGSCPESVVRQEISVPLPLIELPDPEGFYAGLVLRKIRAESQPGWEPSEAEGSSQRWNTVDRPVAAQTSGEVARRGTSGEPIEALLVEMARRHVQTSLFRRRSS
jgi:hypothetical protein